MAMTAAAWPGCPSRQSWGTVATRHRDSRITERGTGLHRRSQHSCRAAARTIYWEPKPGSCPSPGPADYPAYLEGLRQEIFLKDIEDNYYIGWVSAFT